MCSLSASAVACSCVHQKRDLAQNRLSLDTCHLRCACIVSTLVHVQFECKCSCMLPCQVETISRAKSGVAGHICQLRCACIVCTLVHVQFECKSSCMQPCPAETRSRAKSGVAGHMSVEMSLHRVHTCACAVLVQVQLHAAVSSRDEISCKVGYRWTHVS